MIATIYLIHDLSQEFLIPNELVSAEDYGYVYEYPITEAIMAEAAAGALKNKDTTIVIQLLNIIYKALNINHPKDYTYRSLSMGDIIVLGENAYKVADIGFTRVMLPLDFTKENIKPMKNGKKPTVQQRKAISDAGLSPDEWLVSKVISKPSVIQLVNRKTNRVVTISN